MIVETPPPFTVDVRATADGQIEIGASDEPGFGRSTGLCPSSEHPFGLTRLNALVVIGTVTIEAGHLELVLSDGSQHRCLLHRIQGCEARDYVHRLPSGVTATGVIAYSTLGAELARLDL